MKAIKQEPTLRDRTYREVDNGNYVNRDQYEQITGSLLVTHIFLELLYIVLGCLPMVIVNIASILSYVVSRYFVKKGNTYITIWIMFLEVYLHIVFACIFMGMACGYHLWLFGTFSSIFLPFFIPDLSIVQKIQIGIFSFIIVATFIVLTAMDRLGVLPTAYNVNPQIAHGLYYFNAILGFGSIMLYMGIYNARMNSRSREFQLAADHDFLTGIYNRQRMQKILDAEVLRAKELGEGMLAIAIVDIDFFKKINDTYGHEVGDEALKQLTDIFEKNANIGMLYGRWGGEEFMLIAPEHYSYSEFVELLEDIRKQTEDNSFLADGHTISFTISIGAAEYTPEINSSRFVDMADERLYKAKESGRNKIVS